jgi:hypothetical protein
MMMMKISGRSSLPRNLLTNSNLNLLRFDGKKRNQTSACESLQFGLIIERIASKLFQIYSRRGKKVFLISLTTAAVFCPGDMGVEHFLLPFFVSSGLKS